eukprot:m.92248 g.92248  ORF g.92248 m.92248 type:complete len:190 (-) comp12982_c0_seq2:3973-4542(-)
MHRQQRLKRVNATQEKNKSDEREQKQQMKQKLQKHKTLLQCSLEPKKLQPCDTFTLEFSLTSSKVQQPVSIFQHFFTPTSYPAHHSITYLKSPQHAIKSDECTAATNTSTAVNNNGSIRFKSVALSVNKRTEHSKILNFTGNAVIWPCAVTELDNSSHIVRLAKHLQGHHTFDEESRFFFALRVDSKLA